ncbi:hypothetical protein TNCV_2000611 [Trichonephila clavipes]|nr:hypothetical protein TNCV_2000611 [Trichonephila clavipes]
MPYPKESPIYPILVANCCVVFSFPSPKGTLCPLSASLLLQVETLKRGWDTKVVRHYLLRNTSETHFLLPYVFNLDRCRCVYYGQPDLSGKVTGTPKILFKIFLSFPETPTRLTFGASALASSAARENDCPHAGFQHEAISPNSSNIRRSYGNF